MAFPGDYTLYQEVTIDQTKVSGTNANFPALVDLSDMVKAGSDIFDTCRTDGGDIRVTLVDGTTQLAREVVSIDTTAKTGEMWVKCPSLTDAVDLVVRVYYNGIDTEPASDSTYGSENTWNSDYKIQHHMNDSTTSTITGSTSNANAGTKTSANNPIEGDGDIFGKRQQFDGSDSINLGDTTLLDGATELTIKILFKAAVFASDVALVRKWTAGNQSFYLGLDISSPYNDLQMGINNGAQTENLAVQSTDAALSSIGVADLIHGVWEGSNVIKMYKNGTPLTTAFLANALPLSIGDKSEDLALGARDNLGSPDKFFTGDMLDVSILDTAISAGWALTEANNQTSPSTFYSVSDEFSPQVATPEITPASGAYSASQLITITCATVGADIYYTEDGSTPDDTDILYTVPFTLSTAKTIKAIGIDGILPDSDIATEIYTIQIIQTQPIITIQT